MLSLWKNKEYTQKINELYDKYTNVDPKLWKVDQNMVTLRKEEPMAAQQLYSILSSVMQAVLTDENADINELISTASEQFQKDALNKLEN